MDITEMLVRDFLAIREQNGECTVGTSEVMDFVRKHNGNEHDISPAMVEAIGWVWKADRMEQKTAE